jgi:hypothetical protein
MASGIEPTETTRLLGAEPGTTEDDEAATRTLDEHTVYNPSHVQCQLFCSFIWKLNKDDSYSSNGPIRWTQATPRTGHRQGNGPAP